MGAVVLMGLVACFTLQVSGCTAAGYGIGSLIDARTATRLHPGEAYQLELLENGSPVRLVLRDSTVVRGTYAGLVERAPEEFARIYERWRDALPPNARPGPLGEETTVDRDGGRPLQSPLAGFDYDGVRLQWNNPNRRLPIPWSRVERLASASDTISGSQLRQSLKADSLPLLVQLRFKQADGTMRILDAKDVAIVEVGSPKRGRQIGTIVGITADAIVVVAVIIARRPPSRPRDECAQPPNSYPPLFSGTEPMLGDSAGLLPASRSDSARFYPRTAQAMGQPGP
jgi:hypothetical protein